MAIGKNVTKVLRYKGVCGVAKKSTSTSINTIEVETPRLSFTLSILLFFFMLGSGITNVILAQETSEEVGLDDALSSFDEEDFAESDAEVLSGFDDESGVEVTSEAEAADQEEGWSSLFGYTGISLNYNYLKETPTDETQADWSGLTKLRPYFSLTWDAKLGENWKIRISGKAFYDFAYGMKKRKNFSKEVLNDLEQEAEFREVYLDGSLFNSLDIKIGHQIVAWGVANSLRVVDVLNPTDDREFGMTDLEDVRLPIAMTKFGLYVDDFKLEAVAVHKIKFNKTAPFGSDFNPSPLKIKEVVPESSVENTEYGLAVIGKFSGWDASLNWAQYFDDSAHYKIISVNIVSGVGAVPILEQRHSRLTMTGATLSVPTGNFLWKAEAAKLQGIEFALVTDKTFSRTDILLGAEYYGWNDTSVSIESGVQHLNDFDSRLEASPDSELEDRFATSVSFIQEYLNQTLRLNLAGMMIGERGSDGGINRTSLEYDVVDAFSVTGGLIIYQTGENEYFQSLNENDRLFFEARYSF